jgi:hypothetical protein
VTDPQIPQLPPVPEPQPPASTGAQKWTALAVTPIGIVAMIILLPVLGCCGLDFFGQVLKVFGGGD